MQTMMTNLKRLWRVNGYDGRQAQLKMAPLPRAIRRPDERSGSPRVGAVLVLLYPYHETTHLALTRRPDNLKDHSGQVSFPGGKVEPNESPTTAALRETWEELGIPPSQVEVLGELTPLYIPPTDFEVHPFVGWIPHRRISHPTRQKSLNYSKCPSIICCSQPHATKNRGISAPTPWTCRFTMYKGTKCGAQRQ